MIKICFRAFSVPAVLNNNQCCAIAPPLTNWQNRSQCGEYDCIVIIGLDYSHSVMSKNMSWIAEAQELGMLVNVWTINNAADMIMYINNKVDFITTNYPDMCKRYVEQYN